MFVTAEDGSKFVLKDDGTWKAAVAVDVPAAVSPGEGFRKASWGSSKASIKATEEQSWSESDDVLTFDTSMGGLSSRAVFIFIDDQLVRAKYIVTETYQNGNKYIVALEALKELLMKKYGTPREDNSYWTDDLYKNDPDEWGMAVGGGDLSRYVMWDTAATSICLALTGENYDITLQIEYSAKAFTELEKSRTEASQLEDL